MDYRGGFPVFKGERCRFFGTIPSSPLGWYPKIKNPRWK